MVDGQETPHQLSRGLHSLHQPREALGAFSSVARSIGISTAAVTKAHHRFEATLPKNIDMENDLIALLVKNS